MSFHVFDTLTKEKRAFEPLEPGIVRMYNCGPTVYGRAHIGNLRTYLFADTLRRWLEVRGYEVRQVMNITDVGHLQGDLDEGEDKVEAQARREKRDPWEISRGFTELFFKDLRALGCLEAWKNPRASEHVPEMLAIIDDLIEKEHAYQVGGDVYFDVTSFPAYGRLSGNRLEDLEAGARIEVREEKRHPADFALWKSDARHLMKWSSRFGPDGFPGWHIECSAMAIKHLGEELDIHTGGEDNIFPHHECEIAQSESHTGKPFARYWVHAKFLQVDGGKMAKSLGNVYTLDDVTERGFTPRVLRFALIRGHYRQPLNFTWGILGEARTALEKLDELAQRLHRASEGQGAASADDEGAELVAAARARFDEAMDDDLNVPQALSTLFELRSAVLDGRLGRKVAAVGVEFVQHANRVLGVIKTEEEQLERQVEVLLAERERARSSRNWKESDRLRGELEKIGVVIQDTPEGTIWRRRE